MSNMYGVSLLDVVKSRSESDAEVRSAVRRIFLPILAGVLALDCLAAGLLLADLHHWSWPELWAALGRAQALDFHHGGLDLLLFAAGRAVLIPLLTWAGVRLGKPTVDTGPAEFTALGQPGRPAEGRGKRLARVRKYSVLLLLFLVSTGCQVYAGLKVSGFAFGPQKTSEAVLMCLSVLWVNVEVWAARQIVAELTKEQGKFLPELHPHPVFFESSVALHWCDLCGSRIRDGAWRCKLCDFDLCTNKDAAEVGENVLRSDSGVVQGDGLDNKTYLRRAFELAGSQWPLVAVSFVLLGLYCGSQIALPHFQGKIIDCVVQTNKHGFLSNIKIYLGVMVAQGAMSALYTACFAQVSRTLVFNVRNTLFSQILRQDVAFFDGTTSGHLSSRLTNDVNTMMQPVQSSLSQLLQNLIMLAGGLVMCYVTSYQLSMLAFVTVGPIIYLWDLYAHWSKRLNRLMLAAWAEANSIATQAIGHIRTVKAFCTEPIEIGLYSEAGEQALTAGVRDAWGNGLMTALTGYLDLGTGVLILWYGGWLVLNPGSNQSGLTVGRLVTFQLYLNMMNSAYQSLQNMITSFTRAAAGAEKVFALWDSVPAISDDTDKQPIDWAVQGELTIEQADFYYQMRPDNKVLRGLSLHIPAGSVCALVGRSGGGKSTIINLLLRFYDLKGGSIQLDGRPYQSLRVSELRQLIGLVAQDTELFARTIEENIAYGVPKGEYSQEQVRWAAEQAQAHEFIMQMKDGYQTRVGERGSRVSGGQRQRIAIARIFLRRPKIVLLDEATSALDEESQAEVQAALDALITAGGCTVVVVAHRLSTVRRADKIAVVDKGMVAEEGSHDQLVQMGGLYASLVEKNEQSATLEQTRKPGRKPAAAATIDALLDQIELDKGDEDE